MPKFEIRELRSVCYTIEVPDGSGITAEKLAAAKLDSAKFDMRGSGGMVADYSDVESYTVHDANPDDDEPAHVQLDARLKDRWPPEP